MLYQLSKSDVRTALDRIVELGYPDFSQDFERSIIKILLTEINTLCYGDTVAIDLIAYHSYLKILDS